MDPDSMNNKPSMWVKVAALSGIGVFILLGVLTTMSMQSQRKATKTDLTKAQEATGPSLDECFTSIDPDTGEQTNPDCPSPSSAQASATAVIATTLRFSKGKCPLPFKFAGLDQVDNNVRCIVPQDAVVSATLDVPSNVTLDCKGHTLTSAAAGVLDDPTTAANTFQGSSPELAILLNGSYGTKIQNCTLDGFDFGIMAVNAKPTEDMENDPTAIAFLQNKILNNTLNVRTVGIRLLNIDNALVDHNTITYASMRGTGMEIAFDSDNNMVKGNTIKSTDAAKTGNVRRYPGGPFVSGFSDIGIQLLPTIDAQLPLVNMIIGGELVQVGTGTTMPDGSNDWWGTNDNTIEGNTFEDIGGVLSVCAADPSKTCHAETQAQANALCVVNNVNKGPCFLKLPNNTHAAIQLSAKAGPATIAHNTIKSWTTAIAGGGIGPINLPGAKQGTCSGDTTRMCISNADCTSIPMQPNVGTCVGAQTVPANLGGLSKSHDLTIDGNTVDGSQLIAIHLGQTLNTRIINNTLKNSPIGINLFTADPMTLATAAVIEKNTIENTQNAFALRRTTTVNFNAKIRLNDITGSSNANILLLEGFNFPSEFSQNSKGNYWGDVNCANGGFMTSMVKPSGNGNVRDSYPYGVSVAKTDESLLPSTCSQ